MLLFRLLLHYLLPINLVCIHLYWFVLVQYYILYFLRHVYMLFANCYHLSYLHILLVPLLNLYFFHLFLLFCLLLLFLCFHMVYAFYCLFPLFLTFLLLVLHLYIVLLLQCFQLELLLFLAKHLLLHQVQGKTLVAKRQEQLAQHIHRHWRARAQELGKLRIHNRTLR